MRSSCPRVARPARPIWPVPLPYQAGRDEAVRLLDNLKKRLRATSNASEIAVVYAALGENDEAMTWLEKGFEERFNPGVLLRPGFDPLRGDRRFQDLERRVGLNR